MVAYDERQSVRFAPADAVCSRRRIIPRSLETGGAGYRLDDEQRERVRDCLIKERIKLPKERFVRLIRDMEWSIDQFQRSAEGKGTFREAQDALRALWQRCNLEKPPYKVLRDDLEKLPREAIEWLARRARVVIPRLFDSETIGDDVSDPPDRLAVRFLAWVVGAEDQKFDVALRALSFEGEDVVPGRSRGGGKRSRPRAEPMIKGVVRGTDTHGSRDGAPTLGAHHELVMHLALDWLHATGQKPQRGRDDKRGFGDLVHSVFDWLEVTRDPRQAAMYALRRYWDTEKALKKKAAPFAVPLVCADCKWCRRAASADEFFCENLNLGCATARADGRQCGPNGQLFEPG